MTFSLRSHQQAMVDICEDILAGDPIKRIIVDVTPGGGKSLLPVIAANILIPRFAQKICWIVPRLSLQSQAERAFMDGRYPSQHDIRISTNDPNPSRGTSGFVTTYQALAHSGGLSLIQEFQRHDYIFFLDEPHHLAVGGSWESGVLRLLRESKLNIFASGTFVRHDNQRVTGLEYDSSGFVNLQSNSSQHAIRYSRQDSLVEGQTSPLYFEVLDGRTEYRHQGQNVTVESLQQSDSREALYSALQTDYAIGLLDSCLDNWEEHKENVFSEAKMLVVAPYISQANEYINYLRNEGYTALIAHSEDAEAHENIERFKGNRRGRSVDILVTVAMAYEGLDVPQVDHIACLTHIRSRPWLEQCFARANRRYEGKDGGYIFGPDDMEFNEIMQEIQNDQQVAALQWHTGPNGEGPGTQTERTVITPLDGEVTGRRIVTLDGDSISEARLVQLDSLIETAGAQGINIVQLDRILNEIGHRFEPPVQDPQSNNSTQSRMTQSEREARLRSQIKRMVSQVVRETNLEYGEVNGSIKYQFGNKSRDQMTVQELEAVIDWIPRRWRSVYQS